MHACTFDAGARGTERPCVDAAEPAEAEPAAAEPTGAEPADAGPVDADDLERQIRVIQAAEAEAAVTPGDETPGDAAYRREMARRLDLAGRLDQARRLYPTPNAAILSVAETRRLLFLTDRMRPVIDDDPIVRDVFVRFLHVLSTCPAIPEFRSWARSALHRDRVTSESVDALVAALVQRGWSADDANGLPLADAVRLAAGPVASGAPMVEQAEPPAASEPRPAVPVERKQTIDDLSPTAWKLLEAMRQLRAVDSASAATRDKIAERAGAGNADSLHVRLAFEALCELELVKTKRGLGTWLARAGLDAIAGRK